VARLLPLGAKGVKRLFLHLPEQSRRFRLWRKSQQLAKRFLAKPTTLGVCDTLGIERLHSHRSCDANASSVTTFAALRRGTWVFHGRCGAAVW